MSDTSRTPSSTSELISFLAKDSAATTKDAALRKRGLCFTAYIRFWTIGAILVLALSYWLLPRREDLHARLASLDFGVLFLLWSAASLFPALKVYSLAFPDAELASPILRKLANYAGLPLVLLALFTFTHFETSDLAFQMFRESSYLNGGCGMVILVAGTIHLSFLFSWIRRGATASPMRAGAWAAVSTAAFASFVVQFACANENPIHVLLWHFTPLLILTGLAAVSAKRLLHW